MNVAADPISTPQRAQVASLQALRAVAAIMVVLFHLHVYTIPQVLGTGQGLTPAFAMGYSGVEIFFVLSGFIMMLVHRHQFGQPQHAPAFLMKRIERIYPFFWVILALVIAGRFATEGTLPSVSEALRAVFLWPTAGAPIIEVAWSLTFEMMFYIVFSLLLLNLRLGMVVGALWFGACAVAAVYGYQGWGHDLILSAYNLLFLFGICASLGVPYVPAELALPLLLAGIVLFLTVGLSEAYGGVVWHTGLRTVLYGLGAAAIVTSLVVLERAGRLKVPRLLVFLGDASYAIYLVHITAMTLVVKVLLAAGIDRLGAPLTAALVLLGALVAGSLAHLLLEKPILRWLRARRAAR